MVTEETPPPATSGTVSSTPPMATNLEPKQSEPSEKPKKESSNSQELDNSAEVQPKFSSTDFSNQESNERELDSIREKINNPKLRKPHETKKYLEQKEKLLLKNQKLLSEKGLAESKIEELKSKVEQQQIYQNSENKNYLLFVGSGIILVCCMLLYKLLLFKKARNQKYYGKRK